MTTSPEKPGSLRIAAIVSLPFGENTYVAHLDGRDDCVVIDPGLEPGKIFKYLAQKSLTPAAIICTHGHADHIGGNGALKKRWPDCPLVIGRGDEPLLSDPVQNFSQPMGGVALVSPPADGLLSEGDVYRAAGLELEVYETPGHSPGHVVLVYKGQSPYIVFGGDVLFAGSIGRTDLPGQSYEQLTAGIRQKLFTLPDDTIVLPGHGEPTTVGEEKRSNPFVQP